MSSTSTPEVIPVDPNGNLILKVGEALGQHPFPDQDLEGIVADQEACYKLILVSSKILTLVSPVFDVMRNGKFREGQLQLSAQDPPVLDLPEDDATAMLLLCQILHHRPETRSRSHIPAIAKTSSLGDKYGCASACHSWFHAQMSLRGGPLLSTVGASELGYIIQASYTFGDRHFFYQSTKLAIFSSSENGLYFRLPTLLDSTAPEHLAALLQEAQQTHLRSIRELCQKWLGDVAAEGLPHASAQAILTSWSGEGRRLPDVCNGKSRKIASFIATLREVGLWKPSPYKRSALSVENGLDLVRKLVREVDKVDQCSKKPKCVSCKDKWVKAFHVWTDCFEDKVFGICLECVSSMGRKDVESMSSVRCSSHGPPL